jgi:hypothetical protein
MSTTTATVRNATDAFVRENTPSANYADTIRLRLRTSSGNNCFSYIYFARPFPIGATIVSAKLRFYADAEGGTWTAVSRTLSIHRAAAAWKVGKINYNNRPGTTGTALTQVRSDSITDLEMWEVDVTTHMQYVADGGVWYGWRASLNDATLRRMHSANSGRVRYRPALEVTWLLNPDAPTTLSPSGNRAVTSAKPILRFDFTDVAGSTSMNACQVQINSTNVWTSPSFDSGTVLTGTQELDLATTAYAGLAEGASTYWRVRVQDGAGLWSAWSAAAQFSRYAKGTLTITNPSAGIVEEATPPIAWTLTGRTQASWQVIILDTEGNWIHNSAKHTSADLSYTLPSGVIHDGTTYTARVRVWDTLDRESTPGDTAYHQASSNFTYTQTTGVTGVSSFTATDLKPVPGITLAWTRSSMPDSYTVVRRTIGGVFKVVEAGIDPTDVLVSGTSYSYTTRKVPPHRAYEWAVRAVVNGQTSATNPVLSVTIAPTGIWLIDDDTGVMVQLGGHDSGSWGMGEQAAVY